MYYPYFRGKQNELITIREKATLLSESKFVPIIEPVKESLSGLIKALSAVVEADGEAIVVINPFNGDHSHDADGILSLFEVEYVDKLNIIPGILLTESMTVANVTSICSSFEGREIALIHTGFTEAKLLAQSLDNGYKIRHIFFEDDCGKLYRKHFQKTTRILLRDGFHKRTNRKHPPVEFFSELHVTYGEEGMNGFGDFLIVGDDYSEGGGPAYAVAIHLTFIDSDNEDQMFVYHFKSIRQDDPTDPAGKFAEALDKMVTEINNPDTKILKTEAVIEFLDLHRRRHFPGLGYVKKLSMMHHIETLAKFFEENS